MSSTKNPGRFAGLLYVLTSIVGFFAMGYVPGKLIVHGNAAATANNIAASETLFRLGIAGELIGQAGFIFVALALYDLLKGVNRRHASLMVILIVVSIPIAFLNELNSIAALVLVRGADFLSIFEKPQRDALAMLFLNLHRSRICCRRNILGSVALSARAAGVQVAIPAAVPGRLARPRRLRLGDPEPYGHTVAAISGQGVYLLSARLLRRDSVHVVAGHQGRQAASAGRRSLRRRRLVRLHLLGGRQDGSKWCDRVSWNHFWVARDRNASREQEMRRIARRSQATSGVGSAGNGKFFSGFVSIGIWSTAYPGCESLVSLTSARSVSFRSATNRRTS